jgi:hypothetical protein
MATSFKSNSLLRVSVVPSTKIIFGLASSPFDKVYGELQIMYEGRLPE